MIDKKFNTIRTWEECKEQWQSMLTKKIQVYEQSNKPVDRSIAEIYRMGQVPLSFPPSGLELSVDEFLQFKNDYRNIEEIHGWCRTGKEIHNHYKTKANFRSGEYNPREGYYKIVKEPYKDARLEENIKNATSYSQAVAGVVTNQPLYSTFCDCFYNCFDGDTFLEELVTIRINPLFNRNSHSLSGQQLITDLNSGQILHIKSVALVDKSYEVIWEIL